MGFSDAARLSVKYNENLRDRFRSSIFEDQNNSNQNNDVFDKIQLSQHSLIKIERAQKKVLAQQLLLLLMILSITLTLTYVFIF